MSMGVCLVSLTACDGDAREQVSQSYGVDLPVGVINDQKADGSWGMATECKPVPELEVLAEPEILISLDGLTLHLIDRVTGYDQVFAIGVGAIEKGESLTPLSSRASEGLFYARTDLPAVRDGATPSKARWGWNQECRVWWRDENGRPLPVFAGLPFIRLEGSPAAAYGIHGPVDNYHLPSGGTLRRGYVSHGCVRVGADDLVEIYGRIRGRRVPVRIQRAIERQDDGQAVYSADTWMGSECRQDSDCRFDQGVCRANPYSGRSFCTQSCERFCPDRYGQPTTFCVDDPEDSDKGICVPKSGPLTNGCERYPGLSL
jgi:hypothetical protein